MADPQQFSRTATNPKTGEQVGWDGKAWVPIPKKAAPAQSQTGTEQSPGLLGELSGSLRNEADRRQLGELKRAAKGDGSPTRAALKAFAPNADATAIDMYRGMASGTNAAIGAVGALFPPARAAIGAGFAVHGLATGASQVPKAIAQVPKAIAPNTFGQPTMSPEGAEKALTAGAEVAGGAAAVGEGAPHLKKAVTASPAKLTAKSTHLMEQATTAGVGANFGEHVTRTIERGHLPAIEKASKPRTMKDAARATQKYANEFEERVVKDAIKRHPDGRISGSDVADAIRKLENSEMQHLSPEQLRYVEKEAQRYEGKDIPLQEVFDHLKKLNPRLRKMGKASPQSESARAQTDALYESRKVAAKMLRTALYDRLEQMGEKGMSEHQKDYGSLSNVAETLNRNIPRAQRTGKGPSFMESVFQRHGFVTGMAGMMGLYGGFESNSPVMGAALGAAIPTAQWAMERRAAPNARIGRAFKAAGKTGFEPPEVQQPKPPAGLLPSGPQMMPPSSFTGRPSEPPPVDPRTRAERKGLLLPERTSIDVGPAPDASRVDVVPAQKGKPVRTPKGQPGAGQMKTTYTSEAKSQAKPERTWSPELKQAMEKDPTGPEAMQAHRMAYEDAKSEWIRNNPGQEPDIRALSQIMRRAEQLRRNNLK